MRIQYIAALVAAFSWTLQADAAPLEPLGSFDLHLQHGDSVKFFVARNAQLCFAVSTANGSMAFTTAEDGTVQNINPLGPEQISGFDMDAAGNSFVLFGDSHLTEFDSEWRVKQTLTLQAPVASFALVDGRPMGVGPDSKPGYLDGQERRFTLEAYPAPWALFGIGSDRLGILRPQTPTLQILQVEGWASDIRYLGKAAGKVLAATATSEGKIYLLGSADHAGSASVTECDNHGKPTLSFEYTLPEQFNPRLFGITTSHVYLVDPAGKIAWYPVPDVSAGRALDEFPELLSDMGPLREAVRKTGYTGPIEIKLIVSEDGIPQNIALQSSLASVPAAVDAVDAWRFKPAIKSGKPAAVPMSFHIE